MIKMLRIDDRLLHGQVVFMWTKQLNIKGIIVANDELVQDPIQSLAMKLAVPEQIKLLIKSVEEASRLGNSGRIDKGNKEMMTREVYVDETDIEAIQEILSYELPFDIQMIPTNNKVNVKDALRSIRK